VITLTHVCQAWREIFASCPSLWTNLSCVDLDKTRVYLERSRSSPIGLSLHSHRISLSNPFFEFISHVAGRLKSLDIKGGSKHLQAISTYLACPTPLLEELSIRGPVLPSTLLNGDLSPLHRLHLEDACTELPWRKMVNLTSFTLFHASPISASQFLDFFEGAPHLREVNIYSTTKITGVRNGRLVPMACLRWMECGGYFDSHQFDHQLIPVGARLKMPVDLPGPTEGRPLKFIDNLKNLSDFTAVWLDSEVAQMRFKGPNGEVLVTHPTFDASSMLGYLAYFDTRKTERLEIKCGTTVYVTLLNRALLHMNGLRILALTRCETPHYFVYALHPDLNHPWIVVCPELEELVIEHEGMFDIKIVERGLAARALRGAKLKVVRIISWFGYVKARLDVSELRNHVSRVDSVLKDFPPW